MSHQKPEEMLAELALHHRVSRFLFHELKLLDEAKLEEWLALWTADAEYLVPTGERHSPLTVAIVRDDKSRLEERVLRLLSEDVHSQEPRSRVTHLLSNVEVRQGGSPDGCIEAHGALLVAEVRRGEQEVYAGRVDYLLEPEGDAFRIRSKIVALTRSAEALGNLVWVL